MQSILSLVRRLPISVALLGVLFIAAGVPSIQAATRGEPGSTTSIATKAPVLMAPVALHTSRSLDLVISGRNEPAASSVDLYFFQAGAATFGSNSSASTFIGRRHAAAQAQGSFSATIVARKAEGYCAPEIGVVAIDRTSSSATNLQYVSIPCGWRLSMAGAPGSPSLQATVSNTTITVWGSSYAAGAVVSVYLFRDAQPYSVTATAAQGQTLNQMALQAQPSTSPIGDTWTVFAVEVTTHQASTEISLHHKCGPEECSGRVGD